MKRSTTIAIGVAVAIGVVTVAVILYLSQGSRPQINDIWVINLDKDTKRLEHYMKQVKAIPAPVHRWAATHGRQVERDDARAEGVCSSLTRSADPEENKKTTKIIHKPGVVGCWLSHKRLLTHLSTLPVSSNTGHLITEDDVDIPADFSAKWDAVRTTIPRDWDIVYFGVGRLYGDRLTDTLVRWKPNKIAGNTGTYAYMVRHGALPHMLEKLEFMNSPIDVQYSRMLGALHIYIVDPSLIRAGDLFPSSILAL